MRAIRKLFRAWGIHFLTSVATAASVTLVWDANTEADMAGYKVYSGITHETYTNMITLGLVTTNVVKGLVRGCTYYFAVTAFNTAGAESDFSNEISYQPPLLQGPVVAMSLCELTNATLTWGTQRGGVYRVTCREVLDQQWFGWVDLTPDLVAAGDQMEWSESIGEPARFYRVVRVD